MKNHYTHKELKTILNSYGLKIRLTKDLTDSTDDPGNTCLTLFFLYPSPPTDDYLDDSFGQKLINELYPLYDSKGDHHQELTLITQNNELILILNENK